ncbi:hypothetical protein IV203_028819 [Nitzschia inconspicua]|uniref:PAS domain-containing protein n=1 Tax=Nitzschia inconspicua TaxID=303405 RepID=A0A9K3Q2L8_9STRA|nr:hypothetical protein IV203_028819 [Nitzschia inconspicua]
MDQQQQTITPQTRSPLPSGGATGGVALASAGQHPQQGINANTSILPPQQMVLPGFGAAGPGMNAQLIGQLMTNPALAAAAAASPLFPPAAMLTNSSAFYTIPEYYRSQGAQHHDKSARESAAAISNAVAVQAQIVTAGQANQQTHGYTLGNMTQLQQQQDGGTVASAQNIFPISSAQPTIMPYGAVMPPPGLVSNQLASSSFQAHMAASAAASQAIAGAMADNEFGMDGSMSGKGKRKKELTSVERAKQNRERNREHAKSTRLRKKAYIQKLKELVEGLHAERTEEVRQRRVAIQHLAEMQNVRRAVIRSFLRFHANYVRDKRKWETILEDSFWLKQPVTPYRCFRRNEIEQECRISRGVDAVMADAASISAMVESVGSRSCRWIQIKREDFLIKEEERTGHKRMPKNIMQQRNRFQHAISSLSSGSSSSNNGSSREEAKNQKRPRDQGVEGNGQNGAAQLHDYHAKPLPDPLMDQDQEASFRTGDDDSPEDSTSGEDANQISVDNSSAEYSVAAIKECRPNKRSKLEPTKAASTTAGSAAAEAKSSYLPKNIAKKGGISHNIMPAMKPALPKNGNGRLALAPAVPLPPFAGIGKRMSAPTAAATAPSLDTTVAMATGGEKSYPFDAATAPRPMIGNGHTNGSSNNNDPVGPIGRRTGPAVISGDFETSSSNSSRGKPQIRAYYHLSDDDMILMEDVIMCPFIFRTQDAVLCGALAECVMQGMLRAHFSSTNKLLSIEMIYDAMGFMQQLERASGSETTAQIIPGSLEMALSPGSTECRVITLAQPPFRIVNVNEAWTKLTKYTQMEVEGMELFTLLEPSSEDQPSTCNPPVDLEDVIEGRCKCTTRFHCDKDGREFVDFVSSYPLTNANDEITHLLHVSKELSPAENISDDNPDSSATTDVTNEEETA